MPATQDQMNSWMNEIASAPSSEQPHPQMNEWIKEIQSTPEPRDQGGPHPKLQDWIAEIRSSPEPQTQPSKPVIPGYKFADVEEEKADILKYAKQRLNEAWFPDLKATGVSLGANVTSRVARLFGMGDKADFINRFGEAYSQAAAERYAGSPISGTIMKGLRGVGETTPTMVLAGPLGPYGVIADMATQAMNRAVTTGKEKGLEGTALKKYVVTSGLVDAIPYMVMQKFGAGGIVSTLGGKGSTVVSKGVLAGLREAGVATAEQLPPSVAVAIGHSVTDAVSGVDPKAADWDRLGEAVKDATIQALLTGGVISGGHIAGKRMASKWAESHPEKVAELSAHEGDISRTDATKKYDLPSEMRAKKSDRNAFRDHVKAVNEEFVDERSFAEPADKPLAEYTFSEYGVEQEFVDKTKEESLGLSMPEGKDPETLYPADGDKPAIEGEFLGVVNGKRVIAVEAEAVHARLQNDPSKKSEYGEFTNAGNHSRYDFIPDDQVWVARSVEHKELPKWITHEVVEDHMMSEHGLSYDKATPEHPESAHDIAMRVEQNWADKSPGGDVHQQGVVEAKPTPLTPDIESPRSTTQSKTRKALKDLAGIVSPVAAGGDVARQAGHILRKSMAQAEQWNEATRANVGKIEDVFYKMTPEECKQFNYNVDEGKAQATSQLDAIASVIDGEYVKARERVQSVGKLKEFYENYMAHIFKARPESDAVIGGLINKTFRKSGFLKRRKYEFLRDAEAAGLELVTDNPVQLMLIRTHQMNEYVATTQAFDTLKHIGMARFVPADMEKSYLRHGYKFVNDPAFVVQSKGDVTVTDAYDKLLYDQLTSVAGALGVKVRRVSDLPEGTLGVSQAGDKPFVKMQVGAPLSTLAHEIGHQIGDIYGLYNYMKEGNPGILSEMDKLAALRYEGQPASEEFKAYTRDPSEMEAVMLEAWMSAPDKMAKVAPKVTEIWKEFLRVNDPLQSLLTLDRSVVVGSEDTTVKQPGVRVLGRWSLPEPVAKMIENQLSLGLRANQNQAIKSGYDVARQYGNAMNQASLSLSGFHAINVALDSTASQTGVGVLKAARGDFLGAVKSLAAAPIAGARALIKGNELIKAMRTDLDQIENPKLRAEIEDVITAGGRASMDARYANKSYKAMRDTFYDLKHNTDFDRGLGTEAKLAVHAIFAGIEATAVPIMQYTVPRLKLGVFSMLAADIHSRAEKQGLNEFQLHEQLTQAWDSVENRMGQMTYDNLFINTTVKDIAMLAVRSVGWNLGSIREFGGAVTDIPTTRGRMERGGEVVSGKQAYAIGAAITYATVGAALCYAFGDKPRELKDYFFPRTGRKNPDGSPERIGLPTYSKDIASWYMHPKQTASHKIHPMWGTLTDTWVNEDYYGTKIRNEDDPYMQQIIDSVKHIAEAFVPFSKKNYDKMRESNEPMWKAALMGGMGITAAPLYITQSPAMQLANKHLQAMMPHVTQTKEEAALSKKRKDLVNKWRSGEEPTDADREGLSMKDRRSAKKDSQFSPLENKVRRIGMKDALEVYRAATAEEKDGLRSILASKRRRLHGMSEELTADYDKTIPD